MAGGPKMTSLGEGKNFFGGYWRKTGREVECCCRNEEIVQLYLRQRIQEWMKQISKGCLPHILIGPFSTTSSRLSKQYMNSSK